MSRKRKCQLIALIAIIIMYAMLYVSDAFPIMTKGDHVILGYCTGVLVMAIISSMIFQD